MGITILPSKYEGLAEGIASFGKAMAEGIYRRKELQQEKEFEEVEAQREMKKLIQKQSVSLQQKGYRPMSITPQGGFNPNELDVVDLGEGNAFWKKKQLTPTQKMSMERLAQAAAMRDAGGSMMTGISPEHQAKYQEALVKYRSIFAKQFNPTNSNASNASNTSSVQSLAPEGDDWADESW